MCTQQAKYVTFSSAFSSRYAKTQTSNFHKVVSVATYWKYGGKYYMAFVGNLPGFPAVKEIWKPVKNWQSEYGVLLFFWGGDTVYIVFWQLLWDSYNTVWSGLCECNEHVVTILFHDGYRSARLLRPSVRLVACCLCRVKGHLQASQPLVSAICPPVELVGETGQSARVRTRKGSALRRNADNSM